MRRAYVLVRENLTLAVKRNKHVYDLRVQPQTYNVEEWVRCYHPREMAGRLDNSRRKSMGPYLVVNVIWPVNVMIQRSKRSHPFWVHTDKLKPYVAELLPRSWLVEGDAPSAPTLDATTPDSGAGAQLQPHPQPQPVIAEPGDNAPTDSAIAGAPPTLAGSQRPKRNVQPPRRYLE